MPDLEGQPLDDEYYLFTLQNTLPYLPQAIYKDRNGTIFWSDTIQFLANGTLPENMYWDDSLIYRLEVRHGPTQDDALIYEVNNFQPGQGGEGPTGTATSTDNQITNPQFSRVNFTSPFTTTSIDDIEIAPGWVLKGVGAGGSPSITVTQTPISGDDHVLTNPPYAIEITSSGWDSITLTQTFSENGSLWSTVDDDIGAVSMAVTAFSTLAGQLLNTYLLDSEGVVTPIIIDSALNGEYEPFGAAVAVPESTNTSVPPDAFTSVVITWPAGATVGITSVQLLGQTEAALDVPYQEISVERQVDHTFHIYRDSILLQPKDSLTVGWNFALNPWQGRSTGSTTLADNAYTADQTVVVQQNYVLNNVGSNVAIGQASAANNYGFQVTAVTGTSQFAVINYIDAASIRPYWGSTVSSLIRAFITTTHSTSCKMKMRLFWRTSLPSTISRLEPIASWGAGGEPFPSSGWTSITPKNDPSYTLTSKSTMVPFVFEGMSLPDASTATMTLAVVLYTTGPLDETATADYVTIESCSLVANEFAIDSPVLTFDQTLKQCQYYYESSYPIGIAPGTASTFSNAAFFTQRYSNITGTGGFNLDSIQINFKNIKRTTSPAITVYSPNSGTANAVYATIRKMQSASPPTTADLVFVTATPNWVLVNLSSYSASYYANNPSNVISVPVVNPLTESCATYIQLHYVVNGRLGS